MADLQEIIKNNKGLLVLDGKPFSVEKTWVGLWFRTPGRRVEGLLPQAQTLAPEGANAVYIPEVDADTFIDGIAYYRCDPIYFKLAEMTQLEQYENETSLMNIL